jgi:hypothetical protein
MTMRASHRARRRGRRRRVETLALTYRACSRSSPHLCRPLTRTYLQSRAGLSPRPNPSSFPPTADSPPLPRVLHLLSLRLHFDQRLRVADKARLPKDTHRALATFLRGTLGLTNGSAGTTPLTTTRGARSRDEDHSARRRRQLVLARRWLARHRRRPCSCSAMVSSPHPQASLLLARGPAAVSRSRLPFSPLQLHLDQRLRVAEKTRLQTNIRGRYDLATGLN